jgi:hypothetical protein
MHAAMHAVAMCYTVAVRNTALGYSGEDNLKRWDYPWEKSRPWELETNPKEDLNDTVTGRNVSSFVFSVLLL